MFELPDFLAQYFRVVRFDFIELDKLLIKITSPTSSVSQIYLPIASTPHFQYVSSYLYDTPFKPSAGYKSYSEYNNRNDHRLDQYSYSAFIDHLVRVGYNYHTNPIIVKRKRFDLFFRYEVLDGSHRLAYLKAIGSTKCFVAIAESKFSLYTRILTKLKNFPLFSFLYD